MKDRDQRLVMAVQKNQTDEVLKLIQEGADCRAPDEFDNSLIWYPISFGNSKMAELLLEHGANPNTPGNCGTFPLYRSGQVGQMPAAIEVEYLTQPVSSVCKDAEDKETMENLLEIIDSNDYEAFLKVCTGQTLQKPITRGSERKSFLEIALMRNMPTEIILHILQSGVNVNVRLSLGHTPLHWACMNENFDLCKALVEYGAKLDVKNKYGCTPIMYSASPFKSTDILYYLAEHGAKVNGRNKDNLFQPTPLHVAVMKGDIELTMLLIEKGADVNATDKAGKTALESITDYSWKLPLKYQPIVDLLKTHGASGEGMIAVPDDAKERRLVNSVKKGDASIVKYWLNQSANPVAWVEDENSEKPLIMIACEMGHLDVVKALVDAGADISVDDGDDRSVLYAAAFANQLDTVKFLLANGADPNEQLKGPIIAAIVNNNVSMMEALLDAGADVRLQREDEFALLATPLQAAAFYGYLEPVRLLLDRGSEINEISPSWGEEGNWTALDFAEAGIEMCETNLMKVENMKKMNEPELQFYIEGLPNQTGNQHQEIISLLKSRGGKYAEEMQGLTA